MPGQRKWQRGKSASQTRNNHAHLSFSQQQPHHHGGLFAGRNKVARLASLRVGLHAATHDKTTQLQHAVPSSSPARHQKTSKTTQKTPRGTEKHGVGDFEYYYFVRRITLHDDETRNKPRLTNKQWRRYSLQYTRIIIRQKGQIKCSRQPSFMVAP